MKIEKFPLSFTRDVRTMLQDRFVNARCGFPVNRKGNVKALGEGGSE